MEKIEKSFRNLVGSLQKAKLYGVEHVKFRESVGVLYDSLQEVLQDRDELVFGIVGKELAFEKEIFFDLSKSVSTAIDYLSARGIQRIVFSRNLSQEELQQFVVFLAIPPENVETDSQEYLERLGVNNISVGKLGGGEAGDKKKASDDHNARSLKLYSDSLTKFSSAIDSLLGGEKADFVNIKSTLSSIMEMLTGSYQEFLKLTTVKRYDAGTFVHLMNVSILSMYFSAKLGFTRADTNEMGMAGLFHDIGKLYISRRIITKPGKLTDEEFDKIRSHSSLGAEILFAYSDSLGILPAVVAFEHHLKFDLRGYPRLAIPRKPHLASRMVAICDVYDALSQRRSYKNDYPPNVIYDIMIKDRGSAFDPELLDSFFRIMGVWPVGTLLKLSDGRVVMVKEENPDDIFHPVVELNFSQDNKETFDLRKTAGEIEIERSLNPLGEGKQYLNLL